ncbi:MAG: hypothetical protein EXS05_05345 [Planctomycetaceae bacterium]|nr:hypothetical protein [Planctomycetaceae bacterium]
MLMKLSQKCRIVVLACLGVAAQVVPAPAQTNNSYPMLMSVRPAAAVIGQTTEHELSARYSLEGATQVLVAGEGVSGEVVPPLEEKKPEEKPEAEKRGKRGRRGKKPDQPKLKMKFTVAADAVPGVRDFRVITPKGASTVGQLVVARDGLFVETGDNNTAAKAQMIGIPATVCGAIEAAEDLDYFKFHVEAGQGLVFHVRSQRLLNRLHDMQSRVDPMITLKSAAGMTLAASDNYYAGDPLLAYTFEQAGDYLLEVRDVRYQGNADWTYSIEINNRPFVTQADPPAVRPGIESRVALVGFNLPADATAVVNLPADAKRGLCWVSPLVGASHANEFAVLATDLPLVTEVAGDNNTVAGALPIAAPCVICGRIESPSDQDCFSFTAKAGEKLSFDVVARRGWSGLDPFLRILNAQGAAVSEADDSTHERILNADSWLENWTAPADGTYAIEIRDLHLRGGKEFVYAIEVTRSVPYFTLELDTDKTLLAPGTNGVFYVRAVRKNGFVGEVALAVEGLPPGVTAFCGRILANGRYPDACIILQAAGDAPPGAANIRVTGTALHVVEGGEPLRLSAVAQPLQEYYSPGGGRGNYPVELHTVSVAEPMDILSVKASAAAIDLKPGGTQRIDVTIERAEGFKGNVTLDVLYQHIEQPYGHSLPKGVSIDGAASKTLLSGDESQGFLTLKADADAPAIERQLIPVMAHVSINFVMKLTFVAEPVYLSVAMPAKAP